MAKQVDLKTFLTKIINIFPKDMYLVHNWCAIAGDESDLENRGFYFCILEADVRELLNKTFPNNPIMYIKSIRDTKVDMSKFQEILDNKTIEKIDKLVETHMTKINSITDWDTFNFSDEAKDIIFNEGKSFTLFEDDDDKPSIIISKSVFPLINEKTINNVRYKYDKYDDNTELNQIIMAYDYELFQLIMRYLYLNM